MVLTKERLKEIFEECIQQLYDNDFYLIEYDVHENAVSNRLAIYLSQYKEFDGYNIDREYNKNRHDQKRLQHRDNKPVRPDIIIHKRGDNSDNLVVIELKKKGRGSDLERVRDFTNDPVLCFKFGIYFEFLPGKDLNVASTERRVEYFPY